MRAVTKVAIPTTEYRQLREIKKRYEAIKEMVRWDVFNQPPVRNVSEVVRAFKNSRRYNAKFLKSLEAGLKESSYFNG